MPVSPGEGGVASESTNKGGVAFVLSIKAKEVWLPDSSRECCDVFTLIPLTVVILRNISCYIHIITCCSVQTWQLCAVRFAWMSWHELAAVPPGLLGLE